MFTPRQASASYEEVLRIKLLELGQRVDINSDGLARVIYVVKCDDGELAISCFPTWDLHLQDPESRCCSKIADVRRQLTLPSSPEGSCQRDCWIKRSDYEIGDTYAMFRHESEHECSHRCVRTREFLRERRQTFRKPLDFQCLVRE